MTPAPARALGPAVVLGSAAGFAMNTPIAPLVYADGGNAATLMVARTGAAGLLALLVLIAARRLPRIPRAAWPALACATVSLAAQGLGYLGSVAFIPVGLAAVIFFTWPIMIALIDPLLGGPKLRRLDGLAFLVAFAGLALAIGPSLETLDPRGIALALLGAVGLASFLLFSRHALTSVPTMTVSLTANFGAVAICALAAPMLFGGLSFPGGETGRLAMAAVCGFYTLALLLQFTALKIASAPTIAILFNLEPVISILVAAALLGEVLSTDQYVGGALVVAGLLLYSRPGKRAAP
ncbi:MAG: DMT family transporter [Marivibrio sp.]|uniref:DMT family transporter n=1 Tax=Marivibrio sp. TaxID=2039719 RepID=UPI0032EBD9E0